MAIQISETDLYQPIYDYLVGQGYTVRSEVKDCDMTAVRGDDLIIIELKRSFNASLLLQATQRQKITDSVYVAIPRPNSSLNSPQWKNIKHLLRRLELGLILVSFGSAKPCVQIVFHPIPFDRKKRKSAKHAVLSEISNRAGDFNQGGSTRTKLVTAYRENAIHIACCLEKHGNLSPKQLRDLGTGQKTLSILSGNFYGWFERVDRGIYALTTTGKTEIEQFAEATAQYRSLINNVE